ncbi:TRAP transporter substrate-binding protein [Aquamicrobium sp. LC103]|uniref:TRAP transporter substrate-binding protein n=1 Tax=Aquamicrobium sp. LC103 TaxID=1120658 RepID=UPI00063E9C48|nr:TRAP transporter substrate-binding protein [Aquamicrobium sp. LC103]TKT76129.1 TRAP transporter substrate-binding protein [Aquamicrobium sp. LC103]
MKILAKSAVLLMLGTCAASAQDTPVELRFSSWLPPVHGVHEAFEAWSSSIKEKSGGSITMTLYPAEQLGRANDHFDMARDGIADLVFINVGYQAGRFPMAEAVQIPFTVANGVGGSKAFDGWYRGYAEQEMSDVKFCLGFVHEPGTLHSKTEIRTPDQIKGMKIRSANSSMANFVARLGGTNIRVSAPESRSALESGVADAVTFPWESAMIFGLDKVVSYSMDAPLYVSGFAWLMNKDTYGRMSDTQKAVMDEHCSNAWAGEIAGTWSKHEKAGHEELKSKEGHSVYQLTPDEVAAWKEAAATLQQNWVSTAGADAQAAFESFEKALEAEGADVN